MHFERANVVDTDKQKGTKSMLLGERKLTDPKGDKILSCISRQGMYRMQSVRRKVQIHDDSNNNNRLLWCKKEEKKCLCFGLFCLLNAECKFSPPLGAKWMFSPQDAFGGVNLPLVSPMVLLQSTGRFLFPL